MTVSAPDIIGGLDGNVLLPGHGEVHRGPVAGAARVAQERARNVRIP